MKGSLYKRYFTVFAVSLVLCTFLVGVMLLYFAAQYFVTDRKSTLYRVADSASEYTLALYERDGYVDKTQAEQVYALLASSTGSLVMYTDADGAVKMCSEQEQCTHVGQEMPEKIMQQLRAKGSYSEVGYLNAVASGKPLYTVGVGMPVWYGENAIAGYVFVFTPMASLLSFLGDVFVVIQISSLAMLAVAAMVMYNFIKRMTEPMQEISKAAKAFGNGDFSMRVSVKGDDEIAQLARVFNKMADDLDELETTRRTFIGNVSHELRTPMTTIGGYVDGILDGTIPPKKQRQYLEIVSEEVKRLSRLVESTLAIAKMEEGRLNADIANINVWGILCTVMFGFEKRIDNKHITVRDFTPGECYAYCDSDMLHQVLYNLADNAVKFTPENGRMWLGVTQKGEKTVITVGNSGVGIPKSELPFVFDRFYKTDKSRGMDKTGSGLGLYIARSLVQRMDGELTVASVENEYCEFSVTLKTAPAPVVEQPEKQPARSRKKFGRSAPRARQDQRRDRQDAALPADAAYEAEPDGAEDREEKK